MLFLIKISELAFFGNIVFSLNLIKTFFTDLKVLFNIANQGPRGCLCMSMIVTSLLINNLLVAGGWIEPLHR